MKKIKIAVQGESGRMGLEIKKLVAQNANLKMVGFGEPADVVVDFSSPQGFSEALKWCLETRTAFVSGTTGLSPQHFKKMRAAGRRVPVLWAANMSVGVALLKRMLEAFAAAEHFDFQIEEIHHLQKLDSPSGTAKVLQAKLKEVTGRSLPPVHSIREGDVFGVHRVFAKAEEENLSLEHKALNRAVFARGALQAAQWIVNQKAGVYEIENVLFKKGRVR